MKIKFLSAAIILCLAASQAQAYDFMSGGVAYKILSNTSTRKTAAVTYVSTDPDESGYVSTYKGNVVIPAQVTDRSFNTFNVTQIGDLAMFNNQSLYTLQLPEGITAIGGQAFSHCYSLYEINIPSTVTRIADYAFEYCEDLTSISLPARLSMFGDGVFQQCYGLQSIEVDPECTDYKSVDGVLYGGVNSPNGMTLVVYPGARPDDEYIMPEGVTSVNTYAFSANTTMRSVTLSKELANIDMLTFLECEAIEDVFVAEGNRHFSSDNGVLYTADGKSLLCYPVMHYGRDYKVAENVTSIGEFAFFGAQILSSLTLPSTLTTIKELAFAYAQGFREVTCKAVVPPTWVTSPLLPDESLFDSSVYATATLYVPDESVEAYSKAPGWKEFANIQPMSSAVHELTIHDTDAPAEYFNLQGQRLSNPAKGLILTRRGNKVTKELVR